MLDEGGNSVNSIAMVHIRVNGNEDIASTSLSGGRAIFDSIQPGGYSMVVEGKGIQTTTQNVFINSANRDEQVSVVVRREATSGIGEAKGVVLSPKLQKELTKALEALHSGALAEAQKHLDVAYKLAPGNPDVNYICGLLADRRGDSAHAQSWWEKSLSLDPSYLVAMLALGRLLAQKGAFGDAETYLQKALVVDPNSWRVHELLAAVNLKQHQYADTITHAERSLELGKNLANAARLSLAEALIAQNEPDRAKETIATFLQANPAPDQVAKAKRLLKKLEPAPVVDPTAEKNVASSAGSAPENFHITDLPALPLSLPSWIPANVDDSLPQVEAGVACPLQEVLDGAAKNVQQFTKNVDRFTATEALEHQMVNDWGFATRQEKRQFNYVVEISEIRPGFLDVEEYRNGTQDLTQFPDDIATLGLPAAVLLFHPYYRSDFELTCEGLGRWKEKEAWQIHFSQKSDKPSRLRGYRLGARGSTVGIPLKGRAWIQKDDLQVVRMETDLVAPLPDIRLAAEHQDIEFGPVRFRNLKEALWLPATANVYFDFKGRKYRRKNTFRDYLLFSVDDKQKITVPKVTEASADDPAPAGGAAKP